MPITDTTDNCGFLCILINAIMPKITDIKDGNIGKPNENIVMTHIGIYNIVEIDEGRKCKSISGDNNKLSSLLPERHICIVGVIMLNTARTKEAIANLENLLLF